MKLIAEFRVKIFNDRGVRRISLSNVVEGKRAYGIIRDVSGAENIVIEKWINGVKEDVKL